MTQWSLCKDCERGLAFRSNWNDGPEAGKEGDEEVQYHRCHLLPRLYTSDNQSGFYRTGM